MADKQHDLPLKYLDRRVVERYIKKGLLDEKEYQRRLKALDDLSGNAGSVETDRVLEVLTKERFETVWGPLVIGGKETYGIDRQFLYPLVISEVREGKIVDITQVLPAALKKK